MENAALEQQAFGERRFVGPIDRFLHHHHDGQRIGSDDLRGREGFLDQLVGGEDARDQPAPFRFGGIHQASRQAHVHRLGLADGARQALRAPGAR